MPQQTYNLFFSSIALLVLIFMALILLSKVFDKSDRFGIQSFFTSISLEMATAIALTCMFGSLTLSEIVGYVPCRLCWVQRGFMYPAAIFLTAELVSRTLSKKFLIDHLSSNTKLAQKPIGAYVAVALSFLGLPVAIFHRLEQARGSEFGDFCDDSAPCSTKWINEFGFMTIPTMAGIGFVGVIFFVYLYRSSQKS